MIKITIIGSGNVAQHLIDAFAKNETVEIIQVFSRNQKEISPLLDSSKITNDWNTLVEADLYIIAVSDDAISYISSRFYSGEIPIVLVVKNGVIDYSHEPVLNSLSYIWNYMDTGSPPAGTYTNHLSNIPTYTNRYKWVNGSGYLLLRKTGWFPPQAAVQVPAPGSQWMK